MLATLASRGRLAVAFVMFIAAFAAHAQTTTPASAVDTATELEAIEVTGSRIRQVDLETAQPVVFITREDILKQGYNNLADILQNLTSSGNPALSRASPLSAGENVGGMFVNLRGVGAQRTLVLVNGKRLGISTSGFQDISIIPLAMVERVEILKDGASATYGSDAMGGVVNIITRTRHDGLQFNGYYGQYDDGDGAVDRYDFMVGTQTAKGGIALGVEYAEEARVSAADREFAAYPQGALHPTRGWTTVGQYGGYVSNAATASAVPAFTAGTRILPDYFTDPTTDPRLLADYVAQNTNTGCSNVGVPAGCTVDGSPLHKSNTNQQTDLRTPLQRKSLFLSGNYAILDNLRFVSDLAYTDREAARQVAGYPYQSVPFSSPMSIDSYFNPVGNANAAANGVGAPSAITNWWRRAWEVPRVSTSELDVIRFTTGLRSNFEAFSQLLNWDVDYLYNTNTNLQSTYGNLNLAAVRSAVGPSFLNGAGQVQCGTAVTPIDFSVCQPWNPFVPAGVVAAGGLTGNQALQDFLMQEEHATGETRTQNYSTVLSGGIADLPAGKLAAAVGLERREENGQFIPDALAVTAGSTNLAALPTRGGYHANEIFGELEVPILSDLPAVHALSLTVAMRYSDYNAFGNVKRGKALLQYRPIDEVLLRATYSEGFRVPTISDLYAGGSQSFSFYTDPCDPQFGSAASNAAAAARCDADIPNYPNTLGSYTGGTDPTQDFRQLGQGFVPAANPNTQTPVAFFQGAGNPTLDPETSYAKTVGVVWSSEWVKDLSVTLDWWAVKINNTIVTDTPTSILNDCYVFGLTSRCIGFTRDPALGYVNTFRFGQRNAGYRDHEGYDFDVRYVFTIAGLDQLGTYTFNWKNTYIAKQVFKTVSDATTPETNEVGFANTSGTVHRLRSNANIDWTLGSFAATWGARYYSGLIETCLNRFLFQSECTEPSSVNRNHNGSNIFHDAQLRYNTPWNNTFAVGANNIFGHLGDQMYSQPDANVSYNGEFDIGRFVYARFQQNF